MNEIVATAADGFRFVQRGAEVGDDHLAMGGHESGLSETLYSLAEETAVDDVIVVAGAHVGTWAIRLAMIRPVVAYEANPATASTLRRNVEINQQNLKGMRWVHVRQAALWDSPGATIGLVDANAKPEGGSTRAVEVSPGRTSDDVLALSQTETLDAAFPKDGPYRVGMILIDVEGAEARVLAGARALLIRDHPSLAIELHEGHPGTDDDLRTQVTGEIAAADYPDSTLELKVGEEKFLIVQSEPPQLEYEPEIIEHPEDDLTGDEAAQALIQSVKEDMAAVEER